MLFMNTASNVWNCVPFLFESIVPPLRFNAVFDVIDSRRLPLLSVTIPIPKLLVRVNLLVPLTCCVSAGENPTSPPPIAAVHWRRGGVLSHDAFCWLAGGGAGTWAPILMVKTPVIKKVKNSIRRTYVKISEWAIGKNGLLNACQTVAATIHYTKNAGA